MLKNDVDAAFSGNFLYLLRNFLLVVVDAEICAQLASFGQLGFIAGCGNDRGIEQFGDLDGGRAHT